MIKEFVEQDLNANQFRPISPPQGQMHSPQRQQP